MPHGLGHVGPGVYNRHQLLDDKNAKRLQALRIYNKKCCPAKCLKLLGKARAITVIKHCLDEVAELDRFKKHDYIFSKIRDASVGISSGGYLDCPYILGTGIHHKEYGVCMQCFLNVYGIGKTQLMDIRHEVKQGFVTSDAGHRASTTDGGGRVSLKNNPNFIHAFQEFARLRGITLDKNRLASLAVPSSVKSLNCFAWLDDFFALVGETEPNGWDVVIEPLTTNEIFDEYAFDVQLNGQEVISKSEFELLWEECFPNVKRREYIGLVGKCHTCAALGLARKTHKGRMERKHIQMLHACHRMGYMNERRLYYERRRKAMTMPDKFLSIITDGMMQAHCELPWYGNLDGSDTLPQHIQGVLAHGRYCQMFRTYHNCFNDANMQIHTLLLALEKVYNEEGRIPDDVFIQVDGGKENVSKTVIGMCELLVARGVVKRLHMSRLMVGHTHEDIDARFAKVWRRVRNAFVLTMSDYKNCIETAVGRDGLPCKVQDLFVIGDYDEFIRKSVDSKFKRYAKRVGEKDWSVLQFKFEKIEDPDLLPFFPLGVKTSWRPFAADCHTRIVKDYSALCGMETDELEDIQWYPLAEPTYSIPQGMFLLKEFPQKEAIIPEAFVPGSRKLLEDVCMKFCQEYGTDVGKTFHDEWKHFRDYIAPQTDDVEDFIKDHPLHIPFFNQLVKGEPFLPKQGSKGPPRSLDQPSKSRSRVSCMTDYVHWSRRGRKVDADDVSMHLPNFVVDGPEGVLYSVPVFCKTAKKNSLCPEQEDISGRDNNDKQRKKKKRNQQLKTKQFLKSLRSGKVSEGQNLVEQEHSADRSSPERGFDNNKNSMSEEDLSFNDDCSSSSTGSDSDDGWLICKRDHKLPIYGSPQYRVGSTFKVIDKYVQKAHFGERCKTGKIHAVVRRVGGDRDEVYFKFYNHVTNPSPPPPGSSEWFYVRCQDFLSTSEKRSMIKFDKNTSSPQKLKAPRKTLETWRVELVPPAEFDEEVTVDVFKPRTLRSGTIVGAMNSPVPPPSDSRANVSRSRARKRPVNSSSSESENDGTLKTTAVTNHCSLLNVSNQRHQNMDKEERCNKLVRSIAQKVAAVKESRALRKSTVVASTTERKISALKSSFSPIVGSSVDVPTLPPADGLSDVMLSDSSEEYTDD